MEEEKKDKNNGQIRSLRGRGIKDRQESNIQGNDLYQYIIHEEEDENDHDDDSNYQKPKDVNLNAQNPFYSHTNNPNIQNDQASMKEQYQKQKKMDPSIDSTFRGKARLWFYKAYISSLKFFDQIMDVSIVHINKVVLLALFLVSVSRSTVINAILFVMFLLLSMVSHQYEYWYLRMTLFINTLGIMIIYTFDVFIQRDYSVIKTWVLYLIGVQYRSENIQRHMVKIKYVPYIILEVILVLSVYVFRSQKYETFKKQYMDIETQKQNMIVRHLTKRNKALSETPLSKHGGSVRYANIQQNTLRSKKSASIHSKSHNEQSEVNKSFQKEESLHSSFQKEGGDDDQNNELADKKIGQNIEEENEKKDIDENMPILGIKKYEELEEKSVANDQQDEQTQNDQNNNENQPDELKKNLMKQQEMIVMYDPLSKFFIMNAAFFLVFFIFIEVMLLPLSIMNIILLLLMTIIVIKMLYNDSNLSTYRSLKLTLILLNIFAIVYIFTKYLFLFTEYTKNIQLKNSIENGYHQQTVENADGSVKHSDLQKEHQKTEDARNQLHHSHDGKNSSVQTQILQKLFGFQKTEEEKNEGGSLLSFKLLNLAIVLSLTNLLLNILRHRNLPFLLGEKEKIFKKALINPNIKRSDQSSESFNDQNTCQQYNIANDNFNKFSESITDSQLDEDELKREKINQQKLEMNKVVSKYRKGWKWWYHTRIYIGFTLVFLLPVIIIFLAFTLYPLSTISIPSVIMVLILLILLAFNGYQDCWRQIYRSIGVLVQIMMLVCYVIYFVLIDQMSSYDQNDPNEKQQFQNMKVLYGLYQSNSIIKSQQQGQADDVASVLMAIIPLFGILCVCFIQKELESWFVKTFNISIHTNDQIFQEIKRIKKKQSKQEKKEKLQAHKQLQNAFTQGQEDSDNEKIKDQQSQKNKILNSVSSFKDEDLQSKKKKLIGSQKDEKKGSVNSEYESDESSDKEVQKQKELKLFEKVLESINSTDLEQIAQYRGDQKAEKDITNQFIVQMIKDYQDLEKQQKQFPQIQIDNASQSNENKQNQEEGFLNEDQHQLQAQKQQVQLEMFKNLDSSESNQKQSEYSSEQDQDIQLLNLKKQLEQYVIDIIDLELPFRNCFYIKNIFWLQHIAHSNSHNLLIYFGVYAILNKMNLFGLVYWIQLYRITKMNFKPNMFKNVENVQENASSQNEFNQIRYTSSYNTKAAYDSSNNKQIIYLVKVLIFIISFLIITQLSFSIFTNIQFSEQEELQRGISNNFCSSSQVRIEYEEEYDDDGNVYQTATPLNKNGQFNKDCAQDWSYYLFSMTAASQSNEESQKNLNQNQDFTNASVVIDLFFLIFAYLLLFVAQGRLKLIESQKLNDPCIEDENDFVANDDPRKRKESFSNFSKKVFYSIFFVYFPYFLIIYLMFVSATFNGHAMSDLLSCIYLWFALKFIINIKKLFSKNTKILKHLRTYNRIVLTLIIIYQMPLFLCPSAVDIKGYTDPDYITTEDCALIMHKQSSNPSHKAYEAKQPMQLYIILMQSVGLLKENQVNITFLYIFFFTEMQYQIFQHPYFREYVVKHMIIEKESDGKVRAFMYCERFHLSRQWAYRAIKEEIKILHKILLRLNDQIRKSDFAKNLGGFIEYSQKSQQKSQSNSMNDNEESKALLSNQDKEKKENDDQINDQTEKNGEQETQFQKEIQAFIDLNSHIIDNIALANLRPDKPVIPLKIILIELKLQLERDILADKIEGLDKLDEETLTNYVNDMTKSIESYVFTKNRIDLYYKDGIGLGIALDEKEKIDDFEKHSVLYESAFEQDGLSKTSKTKSREQYLKSQNQQTINRQNLYRKLFKSYNDSIAHQQKKDFQQNLSDSNTFNEKKLDSVSLKNADSNSLEIEKKKTINQESEIVSSSELSRSDQDFNPSPENYKINEEIDEEVYKKLTWYQKINYQIRLFMWTYYIDHVIFVQLSKKKGDMYKLRQPKLQDYGIFRLWEASLLTRSPQILIFCIILNFILNGNLLSLFIVITNMCYQILENPFPSTRFWKFMMSYMLTIISLKFLYQLPIFCGTPVYTFYSDKCNNEDLIAPVLAPRIDYIIGIHKFSGPASYPKNFGIFFGIFADIILLMAFLLHKQYLSKIGAWNYVKNEPNIYRNPSFTIEEKNIFNDDEEIRNRNEQLDLLTNFHNDAFVYDQSPWYQKFWYNVKKFFFVISNFYGKVLPQYMDRRQKNMDSRKRQQQPYKTHQLLRVKPGKDYFTQIFFTLLIIDIYTLIYWKNISGEDKPQSFGAATVSLERFSTVQVVTLFMILILLLFERMLYRARYVDERDNYGKFQSQPMINGQVNHHNNLQNSNIQKRSMKTAGIKHTLTIKLFIYYCLLILINVFLGFYIPIYQLAPMYFNPWLVFYYIFWSFYFYYSALQIKYGYPMAPYKQMFSKDTSFLTTNGWRAYKAIPFIWEMKVIIDWTVTSTCLDLFQWFKLDDAYNTLYYNEQQSESRKQRPEFLQRSFWEKMFQGFCFALGLIFIILAPIFLFSGINPIMMKNPVKQASLTIDLELIATGNSYRIFDTKASKISPLTQIEDVSWRLYFEPQSNQIDYDDMQKIQFNTYSENQWTISPPSLKKFINDFKIVSKDKSKESEMVKFKAQWNFVRDNPLGKEKVEGQNTIVLSKKDFLPVIEMLERDNQIQLPQLGIIQPGSSPKQKIVKLSQLNSALQDEENLNDLQDQYLVQTDDNIEQDNVYSSFANSYQTSAINYEPYSEGSQNEQINDFKTFLVQQSQDQNNNQVQILNQSLGYGQSNKNLSFQNGKNYIDQNIESDLQPIQQNISLINQNEQTKKIDSLTRKQSFKTYPSNISFRNKKKQLIEKKFKEELQNFTENLAVKEKQNSNNNENSSYIFSQKETESNDNNKKVLQLPIFEPSNTTQSQDGSQQPQNQTNPFKTESKNLNNDQQNNKQKQTIRKQVNQNNIKGENQRMRKQNPYQNSSVYNKKNEEYEYREIEDPYQNGTENTIKTQTTQSFKQYKTGKALISVKDAFPKLLHLNGKTDANYLDVETLQKNTSRFTSIDLQLNRQGNQIYFWTFSLGSSDGRGGKNYSAYQRDTPGVFNSRNTQDDIENENAAEKRKQSTSKVDKQLRKRDKAEMQKKKVQEEQNLVILLFNEQVIGPFFGNAVQLSVLGLYATIVIAIGRFIRIIFDKVSQRVMYEELPNTKQLFEICEGIFIAQQEGDLVKEKQLYDLLILLYRSPEALIKITGTHLQHKQEEEDKKTDKSSSNNTSHSPSISGQKDQDYNEDLSSQKNKKDKK